MILYYVRHGDPIYQPNQLTPLGHMQAHAMAKRLAVAGIDEIYCSSSQRAMETAQPLCDILKKEMILQEWCNEKYAYRTLSVPGPEKRIWGFNDADTRKLWATREILDLGHSWYEHPAFRDTTFKTGILDIHKHADVFLEMLGYRRDDELLCYHAIRENHRKIALVAHDGMGGAILSHVLGIPYPQFVLRTGMGHSTVTVVEFRERDGLVIPRVRTYSNDSHLYREGYPTEY